MVSVVIISHNQAPFLEKIVEALRGQLPGANRLFVLDRCVDESAEILGALNEKFVENHDGGKAFFAGKMRDFGLAHVPSEDDVLFLDGDRIPVGLSAELLQKALSSFDLTLISIEQDYRLWFSESFVGNPYWGMWKNDCITCGFLIGRAAINQVQQVQDGRLFNSGFDGEYGEEDLFLGDLVYHLGFSCGGFPRSVQLAGGFTRIRSSEEMDKRVAIRKRLHRHMNIKTKPRSVLSPQYQESVDLLWLIISPVYIYYHVAYSADWKDVFIEQVTDLFSSGIMNCAQRLFICTDIDSADEHIKEVISSFPDAKKAHLIKVKTEEDTWALIKMEARTINSSILYIHNRQTSFMHVAERRALMAAMLGNIPHAVLALRTSDCYGPCWEEKGRFYSGGFWWFNSVAIERLRDANVHVGAVSTFASWPSFAANLPEKLRQCLLDEWSSGNPRKTWVQLEKALNRGVFVFAKKVKSYLYNIFKVPGRICVVYWHVLENANTIKRQQVQIDELRGLIEKLAAAQFRQRTSCKDEPRP